MKEDCYIYLESSVFLFLKGEKALLYDTNSFKSMLIEKIDKILFLILKALINPANMYSIRITQKQLRYKSVTDFIAQVRNNYFGDIIPVGICLQKPVVMKPMLNFQMDRKRSGRLKNSYLGDNVTELLNEVYIHLENSLAQKGKIYNHFIFNLLGILKNYKIRINFYMESLIDYKHFILIKDYVIEHKLSVCWICDYLFFYEIMKEQIPVNSLKLIVQMPVENDKLTMIIKFCKENNIDFACEFLVSKESDTIAIENCIQNDGIDKYFIKPELKNNLRFFQKHIFLTEKDILSAKITKRQIYANQSINTNYFGIIHVKSNGDVYGNLHFSKIGNLHKQTLQKILFQEIKKGKSWFNIRSQSPCTNCLYQWLCPSPSDYELEIGKPNLCHVKP